MITNPTEQMLYEAEGKRIKVVLKDGDILEGYCNEFSSSYDNDFEGASITLKNPIIKSSGEKLYPLTEIMEQEIKEIEIL